MKKHKWLVKYWDRDKDKVAVVGFASYEEAITHQYRVMRKFNSTNVTVELAR